MADLASLRSTWWTNSSGTTLDEMSPKAQRMESLACLFMFFGFAVISLKLWANTPSTTNAFALLRFFRAKGRSLVRKSHSANRFSGATCEANFFVASKTW